jgi:hypothetical protein
MYIAGNSVPLASSDCFWSRIGLAEVFAQTPALNQPSAKAVVAILLAASIALSRISSVNLRSESTANQFSHDHS